MEILRSVLAGIGLRQAFTTAAGRHVGVISHRTGRCDLIIHARSSRDCTITVVLTPAEADELASLLRRSRIDDRRPAARGQPHGLSSEQGAVTTRCTSRQAHSDRQVSAT